MEGRITDGETGEPVPGATVLVDGTNYGTAADGDGAYALRLPERSYLLRFSALGFAAYLDSVAVERNRTVRLDVRLVPEPIELDEITVENEDAPNDAGVHELDPEQIRNIPSPIKDGFRALKVMPGVVTNNELSGQYSVRGGGFNENLIFLNGFEVYMPFRPRQGEQEGLGLFNPDLADGITFYTGGFPARYGGKLSSALDVRYRRPEDGILRGSASMSLLDASVALEGTALRSRLGWVAGVRKARARYLFSTQELKGNYQPDYTDLQAFLSYRIAPGHEVEALGILAEHVFRLEPNNRRTFFGTISQDPRIPSNLQSLWVDYSGRQQDGYGTHFGGVRLRNRLTPTLRVEHDAAYFKTVEEEDFNIVGSAILYQVDPGSNPNNTDDFITTGLSRTEDAADNRVAVETWTGQGRWMLATPRHAAEAGWSVRMLRFRDRLSEKSVIVGRDREGEVVRLVADSLNDQADLRTHQASVYVQDAMDLLPEANRFVVTGGLRADYYAFNGQWTLSPRLTGRYRLSDETTLTGAWGIYYQAPTYRELRGRPEAGETLLGALNRDLKAQRSMQFVVGGEHLFTQSRLYLRAEAYYKRLSRLISYDIENVRVLYSGENDARGYTYGLDVQLRGEFVPGMESWVNYSFMMAREEFLTAFRNEYNQGIVPRPVDQRHTVSVYIADYVPGDETWKLHLRTLFGSGLPYTPPVEGPSIGNIATQLPGDRFSARYLPYFRFDLGATKEVVVTEEGLNGPLTLRLTAEILNVFDMVNTVAYSWVPNASGLWVRVPTRLTPRTVNVRAAITF